MTGAAARAAAPLLFVRAASAASFDVFTKSAKKLAAEAALTKARAGASSALQSNRKASIKEKNGNACKHDQAKTKPGMINEMRTQQ